MFAGILAFFQSHGFLFNMEMLFRILVAVLCGVLIGYERKNRGKGAGVRTHGIVAIASCLMMVISQYGFDDFFNNYNPAGVDLRLDPSRVAAQIVSGIGFLGAGMIFIQKNTVTGLTTAAGIWATAGIGMAIGCGMYFMGIACTVVIVVVQIVLHKNLKFLHTPVEDEYVFVVEDTEDSVDKIANALHEFELVILGIKYKSKDEGLLEIVVTVQQMKEIDRTEMIKRFRSEEVVKAADI